ncbi:MAG TPA: hypothetical protein GXX61_06110 [Bacteroidales bacterium]|jgi:hypothetical protein|nr:hypothetical protein [Bacteroidales bacterium]
MQRHHVYRLLVVVSFLWIGCAPQETLVSEPKYFVEELATIDYTFEEGLRAMLRESAIEITDPILNEIIKFTDDVMNLKIRFVTISYNTYDPFGNPVLGTGVFGYPLDLKVKGVVEVPPLADLDQFTSPSLIAERGGFYSEGYPALLRYITITPDMLGVRYTRHMPRPYLHLVSNGMVAYHMRKAVEEYLWEKEQYKLSNKSLILGYSLSGSSSLAVAKYYTENPTGIRVDKIYTGGGVYDGLAAFKAFARSEKSDYLAIPWIILTMDYYHQLGLDYSKIFANGMENPVNSPNPEEGGDGYAYWFNGDHWSFSLYDRWGSDLRNYMHEDFFSDEPKGEFAKLTDCMKENSLALNWTPSPLLDIHLIHTGEDMYVPVECADLLYKTYKEKGCSIQYVRTTGTHHDAAFELIITSLLYMLLK